MPPQPPVPPPAATPIGLARDRNAQATGAAGAPARPSWLPESLFPFRSRFLDLDGARIHFVDEGSGPLLLFLHAVPTWSFYYRRLIAALRGRFRCVALDLPGFGLSAALPDQRFTAPAMSRVVERFVEALDLQAITLVVHDSGGPIGFGVAARRPERFRALVISDTFGWPLGEFPKVARFIRFAGGPPISWLQAAVNFLPWITARMLPLSAAERRAYTAPQATPEARRQALSLLASLASAETDGYMRDVERALATTLSALPVLLMFGERDPARLEGFQHRFERLFPEARSLVIPGARHFPHEESPAAMIAAIEAWWDAGVATASGGGGVGGAMARAIPG
jgi:haloalkane dehalogenase